MADKKVSEVLRAARELIDTPDKWFGPPGTMHWRCQQNCAGTAINRAYYGEMGDWDHPAMAFFAQSLDLESYCHVATWNNNYRRTHGEVLAAFDRAIDLAEAHEASEAAGVLMPEAVQA